jgi:hypothetical protein
MSINLSRLELFSLQQLQALVQFHFIILLHTVINTASTYCTASTFINTAYTFFYILLLHTVTLAKMAKKLFKLVNMYHKYAIKTTNNYKDRYNKIYKI